MYVCMYVQIISLESTTDNIHASQLDSDCSVRIYQPFHLKCMNMSY